MQTADKVTVSSFMHINTMHITMAMLLITPWYKGQWIQWIAVLHSNHLNSTKKTDYLIMCLVQLTDTCNSGRNRRW